MTVIGNAVFQVQIDQGLVRDAHHFGLLLEVINGIAVNVNGDLFFQRLGVGVLPCIAEIVLFEHNTDLTFHIYIIIISQVFQTQKAPEGGRGSALRGMLKKILLVF